MQDTEEQVDAVTALRARVAELEYENALLLLEREERTAVEVPPVPKSGTLDPFVAAELTELRVRLGQAENTVATLKENSTTTSFTSEGPLGQRLLEKCRTLMKENDRLGEALVTSRISQLEQGGHYLQEREAVYMNQLKTLLTYNLAIEGRLAEKEKELSRLRGVINVGGTPARSRFPPGQELQQENSEHRSRERRRGR